MIDHVKIWNPGTFVDGGKLDSPRLGYVLQVFPTYFARHLAQRSMAFGPVTYAAATWDAGQADWDEVEQRIGNNIFGAYGKFAAMGNHDGLKKQLICHQQFVSLKEPNRLEWHLESGRRDASYIETVHADCNPSPPDGK
ncbi:MAG TPA: DUF2599 domain-containing protein [Sporichthyaceae bacterium]|jgi:hypothetical protein|nr:DUF2599 domain-containing protein [Sporichthyaceae bacterium]